MSAQRIRPISRWRANRVWWALLVLPNTSGGRADPPPGVRFTSHSATPGPPPEPHLASHHPSVVRRAVG